MHASHRVQLWTSLLLCALGCGRDQPLAPVMEAAAGGTPGPAVNAPSNTSVIGVWAGQVDVSWQDNSTTETGFQVWRSSTGEEGTFGPLEWLGADALAYSDGGVDAWTPFCYRVRAFRRVSFRTVFSEFSNTACAPTGDVRVTVATAGVDLDPDGYTLALDAVTPGGVRNVATATVAANATVSFPRVRRGDYYRMTLAGVDSNCRLDSSNPQPLTVPGGETAAALFDLTCEQITPPAAPASLNAYVGPWVIALSWWDNSDNEAGFQLERCDLAVIAEDGELAAERLHAVEELDQGGDAGAAQVLDAGQVEDQIRLLGRDPGRDVVPHFGAAERVHPARQPYDLGAPVLLIRLAAQRHLARHVRSSCPLTGAPRGPFYGIRRDGSTDSVWPDGSRARSSEGGPR